MCVRRHRPDPPSPFGLRRQAQPDPPSPRLRRGKLQPDRTRSTRRRGSPRSPRSLRPTSRACPFGGPRTRASSAGGQGPNPTRAVEGFQTRPVLVGDLLVVTTTTSKVIALDAETGAERWRVDPFVGLTRTCESPHRGVARVAARRAPPRRRYSRARATAGCWRSIRRSGGCEAHSGPAACSICARRRRARGRGVRHDVAARDLPRPRDRRRAWRRRASPRGPAGDVRAFDVRTGRQRWRFHTVPRPGEPGHDTWSADAWQRRTGVNVWTSMSVDESRGLVFLPLGSASYDFYGGDRPGANLYANSLVALDAATGVRRWHQQLVHHDIWDYDLPAQPILVDVDASGPDDSCRRATHEDGARLRLRPGHRRAGVRPRGAGGAPKRRPGRKDLADAAVSRQAAAAVADCRADARRADHGHARVADRVRGDVRQGAKWRALHRARSRGDDLVSGHDGRRDVVGRRCRSGSRPVVRQHQRGRRRGPDEGAAAGRAAGLSTRQPVGRVRAVLGLVEPAVPAAAVGPPARRGSGDGRHPLAGAAGQTRRNWPRAASPAPARRTSAAPSRPTTGLVFIAATNDARFRAFDAVLGPRRCSTPRCRPVDMPLRITYRAPRSGRQLVVVAAGGGGRFSKTVSDTIVAFGLP